MNIRHRICLPLFATLLALAGAGVQAQSSPYPSRVIRIISPYAPGGSSDMLARAAADGVGKKLGQTIIIESRPGAGTLIGTRAVKGAPPDGYTLLLQSNGLASNVSLFKDPGYALSDFKPVSVLGLTAYVLMIPAKLPVHTLKEFVAYAQSRNGQLSYGTLGRGGRTHILAEQLAIAGGFKWQEIPYKGGADGVTAVLGGHIDGYFASVSLALPHAKSKDLRLIAISSENRSEFLPDVQTFREEGYAQMLDFAWISLFARSDVPAPILEKLREAFREVVSSNEMKVARQNLSMSPYDIGIAAFENELQLASKRALQEQKDFNIPAQ